MEATLIVRHRQYTDAFFRNLSSRRPAYQESPVVVPPPSPPVSTPLPSAVPVSPQAATPDSKPQFDNLYLDPQPEPASEPHAQPQAALAVSAKPLPRFEKPKLPPLEYTKKQWVLHQHENLQSKIDEVRVQIQAESKKRADLLATELLFFEQVNQAENSLRDVMLREDQRQSLVGVCSDLRKVVVDCLKAGKDCVGEIAGWKECERERK